MAVTITAPAGGKMTRANFTLTWTTSYPQTSFSIRYREVNRSDWTTIQTGTLAKSVTISSSWFTDFAEYQIQVVSTSTNAQTGSNPVDVYNGTDISPAISIIMVPASQKSNINAKNSSGTTVTAPLYPTITSASGSGSQGGTNKTLNVRVDSGYTGKTSLIPTTWNMASQIRVKTDSSTTLAAPLASPSRYAARTGKYTYESVFSTYNYSYLSRYDYSYTTYYTYYNITRYDYSYITSYNYYITKSYNKQETWYATLYYNGTHFGIPVYCSYYKWYSYYFSGYVFRQFYTIPSGSLQSNWLMRVYDIWGNQYYSYANLQYRISSSYFNTPLYHVDYVNYRYWSECKDDIIWVTGTGLPFSVYDNYNWDKIFGHYVDISFQYRFPTGYSFTTIFYSAPIAYVKSYSLHYYGIISGYRNLYYVGWGTETTTFYSKTAYYYTPATYYHTYSGSSYQIRTLYYSHIYSGSKYSYYSSRTYAYRFLYA